MRKIVTCSQMKLLDHSTIHEMHVPSLVLMERAALATANEIKNYLKHKNGSEKSKQERLPQEMKKCFLCHQHIFELL